MKNNLNQHIDTKLKTSFDSIQKKAPEYLWEQISEKMDVEDTLNTSLDKKVETAYLDNLPLQTAPTLIWNKIEDALEERPKIDNVLDEKVKDSFLAKTKAAPAFLWGAISDELSTSPIPIDDILDNKLQTSFLTQETKKTPNKVWYAVSRQLNIDKTWNQINKVLDKEPVVSDWSGRMLRFLAVAALLLFLLRTCTDKPPYTIPNSDLVQEINLIEETDKNVVSTIPASALESQNTSSNRLEQTYTDQSKSLETPNNNLNKVFPSQASKVFTEEQEGDTKMESFVDEKEGLNSDKKAELLVAIDQTEIETTTASTSMLDVKIRNEIQTKPLKVLNDKEQIPSIEVKKELDQTLLDPLKIHSLVVQNTVEPIQLLEELQLEKTKKTRKNLIEGKLEAGVFAVVNSTMLLNNETREGFDQNSLTTNYFSLAANYGLWASYQILPKGALVAEFSINADNKQAYGSYNKGVFYVKEWVMKYNRLSLAYKHDLWQTHSDKLINTKVVAQTGIYVGMMREAKLFYDGVLVFDKQTDYHQFDFGFKVALGQEILIDKFVLGYGIRSDIGASNIFKGNNLLSGREDQTNIIQMGGYILFGYRF